MKKRLVDFDASEMLITDEHIKFEQISSKDIAVIGVSCQIGSAKNTNEFWDSMVEGKCLVEDIPPARQKDITDALKQSGIAQQEFKKAAYLGSIDTFDYKFFSLPAIEAQLMDPHQRLFLETVYATMEDGGYGGKELVGSETGVFVGLSSDEINEYRAFAQRSAPELVGLTTSGNLKSIIAGRISYIFDFKGPSSVVDTACSSSLSALHLACRSIRAGECNTAIAGSVRINMLPANQANAYKMGTESSDGYTRTFDAESDGTNSGEGVAAVLLKPLHQAVLDHDHIYAVVKGSAWNQDGSSVGLTAPNPAAQERVILRAWQDAGIDPESISYLEAHGTGTKLGDPIEIQGIHNAFRKHTSKMQFCAVGSVKTNIGHLDHAAGIAGFIKAVLALEHQQIPPMLHFRRPNPNISFIDSPVYVADRLIRWERATDAPRRCGVSSFGLSGTNCHVVLEEAPERKETFPDQLHHIFTLSAMEQTNLLDMVDRYIHFLSSSAGKHNIGDICCTVNTGRGHYAHRLVLKACSTDDLILQLERFLNTPFVTMEKHHIYYGSYNVSANKATWPNSETASGFASGQVKELLSKISKDSSDAGRTFHDFALAYIQGAEVNWKLLYPARSYHKVSLPTYSYSKSRCWISIPEKHIQTVERDAALTSLHEEKQGYYQPKWVPQQRDDKHAEPVDGKTLFFRTTAPVCNQIRTTLEQQDRDYIEVYHGPRYSKVTDREYVISGNDADYLLLLEHAGKVGHIIHAFDLEERQPDHPLELQERLGRSVYSLASLSKALFKKQRRQETVISVLTRWANAVTGDEQQIHPSGAAMLGMAKVIHQEHPYLYTRSFDLDDTVESLVLEQVLSPIKEAAECAYRNGVRYIESLQAAELGTTEAGPVAVRANGVYVITGGHGGIGLEVAKHWARQQQISIALVSRTPLPGRDEWASIKAGDSPERKRIIESIEEMESMGSSIHSYSADVSDFGQMDVLFRQIRASLGNINGVFHAAGSAGDGMLFRRTREQMDEVLSPKVMGTWNLHLLTKDDHLDFLVLCSSLASLIGGAGQGDYTAANRFMDAFAAYRSGLGMAACSINWPSWKEVGMAANYGVKESDNLVSHISTRAALAALDHILYSNRSRVILGQMNSAQASQVPVTGQLQEQQSFKSVQLAGRESGKYTELEQLLASIWGELFERDVIRVDDNFYDLGGHSLLLIRVEVMLEKHGVAVDRLNIERDRTLEKIAGALESSQA
ncbi:SDR family NAD(P)-dependent oxidoreductase [Paenibacillus tepidiphilus]|uniref:SDR family NAD(P)-dependent oxidoreductase n=1 Tax=Paenibacillus tepidiphilus TaxID=2608683 RepID=UPI00123A7E16|nr:SDR family NAD(P)-dependent oxidoreductase [Paenibacillus tepidiphilus]